MSAKREPAKEVLIENGLEPEYLVTDIVRAEPVSGGMIRLYMACRKHRGVALQFTVVASAPDMLRMGQQVQAMAADQQNLDMWGDMDPGDGDH